MTDNTRLLYSGNRLRRRGCLGAGCPQCVCFGPTGCVVDCTLLSRHQRYVAEYTFYAMTEYRLTLIPTGTGLAVEIYDRSNDLIGQSDVANWTCDGRSSDLKIDPRITRYSVSMPNGPTFVVYVGDAFLAVMTNGLIIAHWTVHHG